MRCPFLNPKCLGKLCGNWNDPDGKFGNKSIPLGCKGDTNTASWARWYIEKFGTQKENTNESKV